MRKSCVLLSLCLLIALPAPGRADPADALQEALGAYLRARDPRTRQGHAEAVKRLAPDVATVADAVGGAWRWEQDVVRGTTVTWERETPDGVVHTVYAYLPESYDPDLAWPALLYLHGNVTRSEDGGGEEGIRFLAEAAASDGFLLLCPSTQDGSHWWMPNGRDLIHGALRDLKRRYRVDADRVAVLGRSDGASACFNLLAHTPDPFCCFVALVGNPLVTDASGGPTWKTNLAARPVYAVSGGRDPLYPARQVAPQVEALRRAGCRITWVEEPEAGHDLSFLERRWPEIEAFWKDHPREAPPASVIWTTSSVSTGRRAWVEILRLAPETSSEDGIEALDFDEDPHVPPQPRLGLRFDAAHAGPGLLVEEVEEGSAGDEAGFAAGDVLLQVGPHELSGPHPVAAYRAHLAACAEAEVALVVRRDGERIVLRARPRRLADDARPSPEARGYGMPPGTVTAEILSGNRIEVVTDGVGSLRLHLLRELLDLESELIVVLNGKEAFRGPVPQDLDHLLAEAWRNGPGDPVAVGCLELEVTPAPPPR